MKCERILSAKTDISKKAKQQLKYNKEIYNTHYLYLPIFNRSYLRQAAWGCYKHVLHDTFCSEILKKCH